MLEYIYLVLDAWEKEAEKEDPGTSLRKDFKYPPVLPIIFYDGKYTWTAEKNFFDRTSLNTAFEKYIPKFEYELVNLNNYDEEEIMRFGDALSFILLIDKVRDGKGKSVLTHLPADYEEKLMLHIPENLSKLLMDVVLSLLDKRGFGRLDAQRMAAMVDKTGRKEYGGMFEAVIESFSGRLGKGTGRRAFHGTGGGNSGKAQDGGEFEGIGCFDRSHCTGNRPFGRRD